MSRSQIVIFTNRSDVHADIVLRALAAAGSDAVRLNTDDLPGEAPLDMRMVNGSLGGMITISTNGRVIDLEDVRSVWYRRPGRYGLAAGMDRYDRAFCAAETDHALGGLWATLDAFWMSRPDAIRNASWKTEQLARAARLGFEVPSTLVTSDPVAVKDFVARTPGRVIFKTMAGLAALAGMEPLPEEEPVARVINLQARLIGEGELAGLEGVRIAPSMFQEYVEKEVELRVTVIGDDIFAAAIHSQDDPRTRIDFRAPGVTPRMTAHVLDDSLARLCHEFVHSYGLSYGALDLIVTPEGRTVFLENNPLGQFLFVERAVPELRLTDALAARLLRGNGAR